MEIEDRRCIFSGDQTHRALARHEKEAPPWEQKSIQGEARSSCTWEELEGFVREHVQRFIQEVLEEEVTALLERPKSARRTAVDASGGYRHRDGKPRRLSLTSGTITVRRPRVRGLEHRKKKTLQAEIRNNVETGSEVFTDELAGYRGVSHLA